jgi:hypothetical protein
LEGQVYALILFDDGTGRALYAGGIISRGRFTEPEVGGVARWNGTQWVQVGQPNSAHVNSRVTDLAVHNDGTGPKLYAAGQFHLWGNLQSATVAKWTGTDWVPVAFGPGDNAFALQSFDDGLGPQLYVGGFFGSPDVLQPRNIARWDGNEWLPVDGGLTGPIGDSGVHAFLVPSGGDLPSLMVGGAFRRTASEPPVISRSVARWFRPAGPCPAN